MNRRRPYLLAGFLVIFSLTSCSKEARMRIHADWTKEPKDLYEYGCYLIAERPRNFYEDGAEGLKRIEQAANMGYPEAMEGLAAVHAMGLDPKHLSLAIHWYKRAAEAGNRKAMLELENAYRFGLLGLPVDVARADGWHRRFEEQGIKEEGEHLAPLMRRAEKGDVKAMEGLALAYESRGESYWGAAVSWYGRAAEGGSPEACMRLVHAHKEGQLGLPHDEVKADLWFRRWQQSMGQR